MYPLLQWATAKYGEDKVETKIRGIIEATEELNIKSMKFVLSAASTLERLYGLAEAKQNIEYINVGFPLVEYGMKRLIASNEFLVNSLLVLGDFDTNLSLRQKKVGEGNNAFGNLLNELERYYSKEESILNKLRAFNQKKREAGHKLYDEVIDPKIVNEKLQTYIDKEPITAIIVEFSSAQGKIKDELLKRFKEYGYRSQERTAADLELLKKKVTGAEAQKDVHSKGVEPSQAG